MKANASKHKAMSYKRILSEERKLRDEIDDLLARAEAEAQRREAEAEEREQTGESPKRYRKDPDPAPKAKEQENFTDPESRIMRDGATKGFLQAYNGQLAVDAGHQIIVAEELDNNASDSEKLLPMVDAAVANAGGKPAYVTADGGYKSEENFAGLVKRDVDGYVACGREVYDPGVKCPRGRIRKDATLTDRIAVLCRT